MKFHIDSPMLSEPADCLSSRLGLKLSPARVEGLLNTLRSEAAPVTELGLQTMDRLVHHRLSLATQSHLHAFQTRHENLAHLFSDAIENIKTDIGLTTRPSLPAFLDAHRQARLRDGFLPPAQDAVRLISHKQYPLLSLDGWRSFALTPLPDTPWALVRTDYAPAFRERSIKPGHVCSLILLPQANDAEEQLADFLSQRASRSLIRRIRSVGPSDYLSAMLETDVGYRVDWFALSLATGLTLEELFHQVPVGYLVWTTKKNALRLTQKLSYMDISMTPLMYATRRPILDFSYRHSSILACSISGLRRAIEPSIMELHISAQPRENHPLPKTSLVQVGDYAVAYITLTSDRIYSPDVLTRWISQAKEALREQGGNIDKCYLATGLADASQANVPSLWSAVLSLHGAQCAQNVATAKAEICESEAQHAGLTVCLVAPL